MPLEASDYFRITRMAYTTGLTKKIISISEQAIESVFQELGVGPYELFDYMDQADPASLENILDRMPRFLVRLTARPTMMRIAVLALNRPSINGMAVRAVKNKIRQFLTNAMEKTALPGEVPQ